MRYRNKNGLLKNVEEISLFGVWKSSVIDTEFVKSSGISKREWFLLISITLMFSVVFKWFFDFIDFKVNGLRLLKLDYYFL
jgi:hypothetical protein